MTLTLQDGSGATQTITLAPLTAAQLREFSSASARDLQKTQPATAYDRSKTTSPSHALGRCAGLGLTGDPSGTLSRAQGLALLEALNVKYVKGTS